jgi:hypothetical protein
MAHGGSGRSRGEKIDCSVRVEAQNDFAELESVSVSEAALAVSRGELFVVDDEGIGLGKVRYDPLAALKSEAGVLPTDGVRPQANVLRGVAWITPQNQLGGATRNANEANLMVMWITREDFEMSWEELHRFVDRAPEAHRLGRCRFVVGGVEVAHHFERRVHRRGHRHGRRLRQRGHRRERRHR